MAICALGADDAPAARALVEAAVAGTPYGELPRLALERSLAGESSESLAIAASHEGRLAGLVLYGLVAGARGAAKLHLVAVAETARRRGIGARLLEAAIADLEARGARLVVAEAPDDPAARAGLALLERSGFVMEGRVADFHRDGVDLLLLRRGL